MAAEIKRNLAESSASPSPTESKGLNMDVSESHTYMVAGALGQAAEVETLDALAQRFESFTGGQARLVHNLPTGLAAPTAQLTTPPRIAAALQPFDSSTKPQPDLVERGSNLPPDWLEPMWDNLPNRPVVRGEELPPRSIAPQNESALRAQAEPAPTVTRAVELQQITPGQIATLPVDAVLAELVTAYARPGLAEPNKLQPARLSVGLLTREAAVPATFIAEVPSPDEQHWPVALPERRAKAQEDAADNSVVQRTFAEKLGRPDTPDEVSGVTPVMTKLGTVEGGTPLAQVTIRSAGHVAEQLAEPLIVASEYLVPSVPRSFRLKLRPAELGQVEVELRRDAAGRLDARLTVSHEETSRVLGDELGQLREALERAGLQVGRLDVSTYVSGHGAGWHTSGQSNQPDYAEAQAFAHAAEAESFALESNLTGGAQAAQDRLLNLHA
jgi:hypothetical protein